MKLWSNNITRVAITVASLSVLATFSGHSLAAKDKKAASPKTKQVLSKTYFVDRKYKSMMGPQSMERVYLLDEAKDKPELLWITGYEAVMVGKDGESAMPQEFMCHSNLDWNVNSHRKHFTKGFQPVSSRLFTLSQGQFDINLPEGFGIPAISTEPLSLTTQVLNLNHDDKKFDVRHKVTIKFVRDKDLKESLTALYPTSAYGLKLLEGESGHFNVAHNQVNEEVHGSGCLTGENAAGHDYKDAFGRVFTGHWVVKPGKKEVNHTLVTQLMNLQYDTKVHYIAIHLHPFAESLALKDLTTGKTIYQSKARNYKSKIGLKHVDYFASKEGIQLYKDHQYELVSVYNNTSLVDQDSMAVMYFYVEDKNFDAGKAKSLAKR